MKKRELSPERRAKIHEANERARLKLMMLSEDQLRIEENVVVCYNGKLIDMPRSYARGRLR